MRLAKLVIVVGLFWGGPTPSVLASPQNLACEASGGVVDASGAVLPGATVALLPSGPVAVTGPDGTFCLREIPAGEHVATVSLDASTPAG